jgi:nucleoside-diphosphate-sugar epimerase
MLDSAEAERDLGWRPHGFHTGLDRLLTWALASRAAVQAREVPIAAE